MKLDKKTQWVVPSGIHQAVIVDARILNDEKKGEQLRIIAKVTSLVSPTEEYVVRKIYNTCDGAEIITMLEELLGDNINQVINLAGEIISDALLLLRDINIDVEVLQKPTKKHENPFCDVVQIKCSGTLIEQVPKAA